ncbi:MAG: PfkB family carbohydrate kinase [Chitinophagales bacterium]|nr:PfkB family carbohydrate kinase [Chitinophagales bacterium]
MKKSVICIGAALVDELYSVSRPLLMATTNDAFVHRSAGGVARNIAHQLALLDVPVQLISVFGNDGEGDWLKTICSYVNIQLDASITNQALTGKYTGILNYDRSLFTALLTNTSLNSITPQHLQQHENLLSTSFSIVADANIHPDTVAWLAHFCNRKNIPFIIEPVSVPPAQKFAKMDLTGVDMITPNEDELPAMCSKGGTTIEENARELINRGVKKVWLHRGKEGSMLFTKDNQYSLSAPEVAEIKDVTGAGDGSLSGWLMAKYLGLDDEESLKVAHTLSAEILQVNGAIATHLDQRKLLDLVSKYYSVRKFL